MALVLKGGEFIVTGPLTMQVITGLKALAVRRPVKINGQEFCSEDLVALEAKIEPGTEYVVLGTQRTEAA